ncbi:hypothetical protein D9M73_180090 [compost metagenome]
MDGNSIWVTPGLGSTGSAILARAGPLGRAAETCAAMLSASLRDRSPTRAMTTLPAVYALLWKARSCSRVMPGMLFASPSLACA